MPPQARGAAVAAALVLLAGAWTCAATASEDGAGHRSVTLPDGAVVALTMTGSGPPLVFIHGWACNREHWRAQIPVFAADHTVVALDLPGHGGSTGERESWTLEQYGADVATVVDALALDHVVLVGHSMGGPVALEAARRLGPRVAGIVAVDTLHDVESEIDPKMLAQLEELHEAYRKDFAGVCPKVVPKMFIPGTDPEHPRGSRPFPHARSSRAFQPGTASDPGVAGRRARARRRRRRLVQPLSRGGSHEPIREAG